ncbi:kynureninase 2 [Chaetomium fimeti]|uniref:Kynureninase n=1 Tax=Chaetomium fimeti TaxID=1854472 RepID=A0AAE0LT06_9PEZI|nr:kynureninase 2 [Chaetomium fimeti]
MDVEYQSFIKTLRAGQKPEFPAHAKSIEYARQLDAQDKLSYLRDDFNIPTKDSLRKKALNAAGNTAAKQNGTKHTNGDSMDETSIYFVGNSLGAQPKCIRQYIDAHLETWASIGVNGHFTSFDNSPLASWQDMAAACAAESVDLVGAKSASEIIYMNTLTVNLHLMMASFYRPTAKRHKIIAEWKPFPSDSYAIASQLQWHGLSPSTSLIEIHPPNPTTSLSLSTAHILSLIDAHADSTALLLLPGIQYYTGQLFDIARITQHARAKGIVVGWDLAHAVGNVEMQLHEWGVDFAVWCTYKYLNAGPGAVGGVFVHERHHHHHHVGGNVGDVEEATGLGYRHRLAGWYGADKQVRFEMEKVFRPAEGAAGWQVSNPSVVDLACVRAALGVFGRVGMRALRDKAVVLTGYLEWLLLGLLEEGVGRGGGWGERGSQLSLLLKGGLLERVSRELADGGVVVDVRKPDVIRVAPVPMYSVFKRALEQA